jgi:hypothetical protein
MDFIPESKADALARIEEIARVGVAVAEIVDEQMENLTYRDVYTLLELPEMLFMFVKGYALYHGLSPRELYVAFYAGCDARMIQRIGVKAEDASTEEREPVKDDLGIWGATPRILAIDVIVQNMITIRNLKTVLTMNDRKEIQYAIDIIEAHSAFITSVNAFSQQEIDQHYTKTSDRVRFGNDDKDDVARAEFFVALSYGIHCKSELMTGDACL